MLFRSWRDVRSDFPSQPIKLYGPGTDSGTFDYFTEVIVGKAKSSRPDYQASEDDNVLVQGVAGDPSALGYFGHAYVKENTDKLKVVGVDAGSGCVQPTDETIANKTYAPLSRPVFIYVAAKADSRPEVKAFVEFYLANVAKLATEVGFIALPDTVHALVGQRWAAKTPGSVFHGHAKEDKLDIEALLKAAH